jgi:hypothetical protein
MLLLDAMTGHLGHLESWPTYILQHLFLDRPSPVRTSRPRKVISFFYGNDIPLKMAYIFYNACSGCTGATARLVVEQTREWYCEWHCSKFKRHISEYYNMLFKHFYYINGCQLNQLERVLPEVTSIQYGIEDTTHPHKIRRRLEETRTLEI